MKPTTFQKKSRMTSRGIDEELVEQYIEVKSKEHCDVVGQDCERCSVSAHCEHRK